MPDLQPNWLQQLVAGEIIQSYKATVDDRNRMAALADQYLRDKQGLENSLADAQASLQAANSTIAALQAASVSNQPLPASLSAATTDPVVRAWQVMVKYGFTAKATRDIWGSGIQFGVATDRSQFLGGPPPRILMLPNQFDSDPFWFHELLHAANQVRFAGAQLSEFEDSYYQLFLDTAAQGDPRDEGIRALRAYIYKSWPDPDDNREHLLIYTAQRLLGRYKALPERLWPFYAPLLTGEPLVTASWDNPEYQGS